MIILRCVCVCVFWVKDTVRIQLVWNIFAFKGRGLPGSDALNFTYGCKTWPKRVANKKLFSELAQDVRDVANLISDSGSTQEHLIVMELSRTPYYFSD